MSGMVHAPRHDGNDYTLCGAALEGENGDEPAVVSDRLVTCPECIALIRYCKGISAKVLRPLSAPYLNKRSDG